MAPTACANCGSVKVCQLASGKKTHGMGGVSAMSAVRAFVQTGTCSESTMKAINQALGHPMKSEENAVAHLAGGILNHGYQCGILWGASLAAGAEAYRLFGSGPQAEEAAVAAVRKIVETFEDQNKTINCLELTDGVMQNTWGIFKFFLKGGPIGCIRMVANCASKAFHDINSTLSDSPSSASCSPASCASELARRMGASEKHAVMAAGLAGGIGLSGGGCGALGAAIWLLAMNCQNDGVSHKAFTTKAEETIDRFLKASNYEFECAEIVGRKFETSADHGSHLSEGGCAKILEALAASGTRRIAAHRPTKTPEIPSRVTA